MKIDIVGSKKSWENLRIMEELKRKAVPHEFIDPKNISYETNGKKISLFNKGVSYRLPTLVFCRGGFTHTMPDEGRLFLNALQLFGVIIVDPAHVIFRDIDKFYYSLLFAKHSIPHVRSAYRKNLYTTPVVIKPLIGSKGEGITKEKKVVTYKKDFFYQELFPESQSDIRVLVLGNKVIGAMKRTAQDGEWRSNVALGGRTECFVLSEELRDLAVRAARVCEIDFAGVDILTSGKKHCVIEVNRAPQFKGLATCLHIPIAEKIVHYLISRCKQ